jgi:hypothetical protein
MIEEFAILLAADNPMFQELRHEFAVRGTESVLMSSIDRGRDEP